MPEVLATSTFVIAFVLEKTEALHTEPWSLRKLMSAAAVKGSLETQPGVSDARSCTLKLLKVHNGVCILRDMGTFEPMSKASCLQVFIEH